MSDWNYDISQAPKGHFESRKSPKGEGYYEEYVHDHIIIATKCGKVTRSYWVPKDNRWCMISAKEEPDAWMPWPEHTIGYYNGVQWIDIATVDEIRKAEAPAPHVVGSEITDLMLSRACSAYVTAQEYGVSNREAMRFVLETLDNQDANLVDLLGMKHGTLASMSGHGLSSRTRRASAGAGSGTAAPASRISTSSATTTAASRMPYRPCASSAAFSNTLQTAAPGRTSA